MTLDFPVPAFVEIFSGSENVSRCLWSCKFDGVSLSRLECLEKQRESHPTSSYLTNKADITCHLFKKETFQAHVHATHCVCVFFFFLGVYLHCSEWSRVLSDLRIVPLRSAERRMAL